MNVKLEELEQTLEQAQLEAKEQEMAMIEEVERKREDEKQEMERKMMKRQRRMEKELQAMEREKQKELKR